MFQSGDDFGCRAEPRLLCAESDRAFIEIKNLGRLAKYISNVAQEWGYQYRFSPEFVCEYNRIAMDGIDACAGQFRDRVVLVGEEEFIPPHFARIPELVRDMCDDANDAFDRSFHAAAYLLWRTNWIHPFYDGNGRVSREIAFLALLVQSQYEWSVTLPELIDTVQEDYLTELRAANKAWDGIAPHVEGLQFLIEGLFIGQLNNSWRQRY